jgi:hypothetical protein
MQSIRLISLIPALGVLAGLALGPLLGRVEPRVDAGVALRLETDGLVERAERVVEGRVLSSRAVERADGSLDTEYRIAVARTFRGPAATEQTVRLPGGVREDGSGLLVAGIPRLELGEDVLLFLGQREQGQGRCLPVGLAQGRYTLLTDRDGIRRAVRSGVATAMAARARVAGLRTAESRPYADLAAEIEAAVNRLQAHEARNH